jgi:dihydroneopterin aldolase
MDTITISGLKLETVIGVYTWERALPRKLLVDLELGTDIRPAAASDDVADTVDYQAVAERLQAFAADARYQLLEALAEALAELLQREFGIPWLRLRLDKPGAVRGTKGVGLVIERGGRG